MRSPARSVATAKAVTAYSSSAFFSSFCWLAVLRSAAAGTPAATSNGIRTAVAVKRHIPPRLAGTGPRRCSALKRSSIRRIWTRASPTRRSKVSRYCPDGVTAACVVNLLAIAVLASRTSCSAGTSACVVIVVTRPSGWSDTGKSPPRGGRNDAAPSLSSYRPPKRPTAHLDRRLHSVDGASQWAPDDQGDPHGDRGCAVSLQLLHRAKRRSTPCGSLAPPVPPASSRPLPCTTCAATWPPWARGSVPPTSPTPWDRRADVAVRDGAAARPPRTGGSPGAR